MGPSGWQTRDPMRKTGLVTIYDVAREAGVSAMTVSNVINDHPHVRDATRTKVVDAMTRLDYRINVSARNLRAGRTGTIGLVVPEFDRPYFGQLAARIVEAATSHGFRVVLEQTGARRDAELESLSMSRNSVYDGLILSAVGLGAGDAELLRVENPLVILGERIFEGPVDHVAMPNAEGARLAVAHLIDAGCRRIAMIGDPDPGDVTAGALRMDGYRRAHADAGRAVAPELLVGRFEYSMAGGHAAITRLMGSGAEFDGVFCVTDTVAMGVLRGLADAGRRVPDDVRVVGFDEIPESAYLVPGLTSVDPDHDFMARTAVDRLVQRIEGDRTPAREFLAEPRLMIRGSSARR